MDKMAQAAKNTADTVAGKIGDMNLDKVLESAKGVVGAVTEKIGDADLGGGKAGQSFATVKQNAQNAVGSAGSAVKGFVKSRGFKIGLRVACILVAVAVVGISASVFAGREIRQMLASEEDYARSVLLSGAEKVVFSGVDSLRELPELLSLSAGQSASGTAELSLDASVPEDYLEDLLDEYGSFDEQVFEVLKVAGTSKLNLRLDMDMDSRNPALALNGGWKVDGKDILNADVTLVDSSLYVSAPKLYGDTVGIDLSSVGFSGLDIASLAGSYSDLSYYGISDVSDLTEMLSDLSDSAPQLKPVISRMLEAAAAELDVSVEHDETVSINGKSVKLDAVVMDLSEQDLARAAAAALQILADDEDALDVIVDMSEVLSDISVMGSVRARDLAQMLEDAIRSLESYSGSSGVIPIKLYVNGSNTLCGFGYEDANYGQSLTFAAVSGTGYAFNFQDRNQEISVFGKLSGLGTLKGDVNLYAESYGEVVSGKLCDFTLKPDLENPSLSVSAKMTDILDLLDASGQRYAADQLAFFEDAEFSLSLSGSKRASALSLELADPNRKAKLAFSLKGERKGVNIKEPDVRTRDVYSLTGSVDFDEVMDNVDVIVEDLDKMGFDVSDIVSDFSGYASYFF
jgi:hypothetical protein